ncbi:NUDIX hydrolase [Streptomyces sp. NPDC048434]|uniref:NUDIX hydrolase n=1 Tax=Streptomyces sp. NPDC048434 TaxID=3365549 RepID=UPI00371F311C
MPDPSAQPLASDARGNLLASFTPGVEGTPPGDAPMPMALTALWHGDKVLMVYDRFRENWELPGGMIEPGESPRQAAVRELFEESGQEPDGPLRFVGYPGFLLGAAQHAEYGALFTGNALGLRGFEANDEIASLCWWDLSTSLPGRVAHLDVYLARLSRATVSD